MRKIIFFLVLAISTSFVYGQTDTTKTKWVKYSPDFKFEDGLYLNFSQVKQNDPLPVARVITSLDSNSPDFFEGLLRDKSVYYYDDFGVRQEIKTDKIWGYSQNGALFILFGQGFNRVTVIGSICHFLATVTNYNRAYPYDPFYNNYYNYYYYGMMPQNYATSEMRQYLIDFKTGKVLDYDEKSVETLLMSDPELHDEYAQLRTRKRDQLKFMYIRKFNERNPLMLPQKH
ncbi:MAG: hypothetical protein Q8907_10610 [Bacteroidota bacterium]|nr:hypothetical protein [Bacteroidota bacterium]MDP4224969.1 hypothetical protein [Bacteroidota bacterium]MDP4274719.1 hypothetical protein [Bacteroidota bacterium]